MQSEEHFEYTAQFTNAVYLVNEIYSYMCLVSFLYQSRCSPVMKRKAAFVNTHCFQTSKLP